MKTNSTRIHWKEEQARVLLGVGEDYIIKEIDASVEVVINYETEGKWPEEQTTPIIEDILLPFGVFFIQLMNKDNNKDIKSCFINIKEQIL